MRFLSLSLGLVLCAAALLAQAARRAPGFSLPDVSGRQHDLQDYRGKVVIIDIMKTDCPHCRDFSRVLEQVKTKYTGKVAVLSVVLPPDTADTVKRFLGENKLSGPVLFDCGQMSYSYIRPVTPSISMPQLFIVGPDGMIRSHYRYEQPETRGIFEAKRLFAELDAVLAKSK